MRNSESLISILEQPIETNTDLQHTCTASLPIEDAARLSALASLYPNHTTQSILTLLLTHSLDKLKDLEESKAH